MKKFTTVKRTFGGDGIANQKTVNLEIKIGNFICVKYEVR